MTRVEFQFLLEEILGSRNVYFQPPASKTMQYPAIVYSLKKKGNRYANNGVYLQNNSYTVTVIDKNPESAICEKIEKRLSMCSFDRAYTADNLNHFVYTIFI